MTAPVRPSVEGRARRLAAITALVSGALALGLLVALTVSDLSRGWWGAGPGLFALVAGWQALIRRGLARAVWTITAGALLALGAVLLFTNGKPVLVLLLLGAVAAGLVAARATFRARRPLPAAPRPAHPVMIWNPRSGGGKAKQARLEEAARERGIEPIELGPGADLEQLAEDAVRAGADGLAMAGGDGSQAIVARVAAEHGLPFACIPAGTRNHFALDLGVDRDDLVGALDAFVDGGEQVVDLGEVNGHVFVNNVSLGVYGEAVQRPDYRAAKLRTLLEAFPDAAGPRAKSDLHWRSPDGVMHDGGAVLLVSNNRYVLGNALTAGTRPRLDAGRLGVVALGEPGEKLLAWSARTFDVQSNAPISAGIDGEAVQLAPPLRFSVRRRALRCRIARQHPGASPSALEPIKARDAVRALVRIAVGRVGAHS